MFRFRGADLGSSLTSSSAEFRTQTKSEFYETDKTVSSEQNQGSAPKVRIVFTAADAINFSGCVTKCQNVSHFVNDTA